MSYHLKKPSLNLLKLKVDIYNFNKLITKKIIIVSSIVIIVLGISSIIPNPVGGVSMFVEYNAPWWMYVITSIILIISTLTCFGSIFSPLKPSGYLKIENDKVEVSYNSSISEYDKSSIGDIVLEYDPRYGRVEPDKTNYRIDILTAHDKRSYNLCLSVDQKVVIDKTVKLLLE